MEGKSVLDLAPPYFRKAAEAPEATLKETEHLGRPGMAEGPGRGKVYLGTRKAGQNSAGIAAPSRLAVPCGGCSALEVEPGALGSVLGDHNWSLKTHEVLSPRDQHGRYWR